MDIFFTLLLVVIWPLIGLLFGWWGSYIFLPESMIPYVALVGFALGLFYGIKKWQDTRKHLYAIGWLPLIGALSFYMVCVFGFFMGVPVFHVFLAIPAGLYCGRRMKRSRNIVWIMGGMTALIAAASGVIAWTDPYTLANLRGMLQLQLTRLFLSLVIWIGGFLLVGVTMLLTKLSFTAGKKSIKKDRG